mmetsp:Transcript_96339/g.241544  ORF Transcript_96339/g.241544 Transcript_96339/m.241544 type:complete len:1740 (-) Transcript_96339:98-5317(-)
MLQSAPQEREVKGPPLAGPTGAEQSIPLVNDGSSEEELGVLHHPHGNGFGVRQLSVVCAVAALIGVAVLFASGSSNSKELAASHDHIREALVELESVSSSSSGEKKDGGNGIWNALKKVRFGPPTSREPDAQVSDDIEPELSQGPTRICTDGWQFAFKTRLSVGLAKGNQTILESSTGALILKIEAGASKKPSLTFRVTTFNWGTVQIARDVEVNKTYDLTLSKNADSVCMDLCEYKRGQMPECGERHLCTFAPSSMPPTSFQMKKIGPLAWVEGPIAKAMGFAQVNGSVPVSFVLDNVPFKKLYHSSANDWNALVQRLQKTLAGLAGNSVMPIQVAVNPASAAPDNADGTLFQATVSLPEGEEPGFACKVQDQMLAWAKGDDMKSTAFNIAVKATTSDLSFSDEAITLAQASVPGETMGCVTYHCRLSNPHGQLPTDATCLGGGCESTCCQSAWSDVPVQYHDGQTTTSTTSTTKAMPEFNINSTTVEFDCFPDTCCKLFGPPGTVPLPKPLPLGLGLKKGEDWDFAPKEVHSVFSCQELCALTASCTGITYTDDSKCIFFNEGHCTISETGGSKWRYPDRACEGATTCNALRVRQDPEEQVKAAPASDFKMPDFNMPTVTTTTTKLTLWQEVLYNTSLSLAEQASEWAKAKGESIMDEARDMTQPINTDGFDLQFKVDVRLKKGACKKPQNILTSNFGTIVVRTTPKAHDEPFKCKVEFKAFLLNMAQSTGGCKVETLLPLHEGGFYEISVSRTSESCCITAKPAAGLMGKMADWYKEIGGRLAEPVCANRTAWIKKMDFQLRPVTEVYKVRSPAVHTSNYVQQSGGLTLSFKAVNVSYWKLSKSDLVSKFKDAIQESVAYVAAIGLHYDNVFPAIKHYWDDNAFPDDDDDMDQAEISLPEPSEEVQKSETLHQKKLATLMNGTAFNTVHSDIEKFARKGWGSKRRLSLFGMKKWKLPAWDTAILVQVTLVNCGTCSKEKTSLESPGTAGIIAQRIIRAIGDGSNGKATVGTVSVEDVVVPGKLTTCKAFQCQTYNANNNHRLLCYGGSCLPTCCKPRFCSQVKCKAPLVNTLSRAHRTCNSEEDCGEKCCELPCTRYLCTGASVCPAPNSWLLTAPPGKAQQICCREQIPQCCTAPIAWCIACLKCQTREAYCMSCLFKWMPKGIGRRLIGADSKDPLMLLPPPSISGNDLSGGLPPMVLQPDLTLEEIAEDEREAADAISTGGASLTAELAAPRGLAAAPAPALRGGDSSPKIDDGNDKAREAKDRYRRLQSSQQKELLAGMMEQVSQAQAWRLHNRPPANIKGYSTGATTTEMWQKTWNQVILDSKAQHHGVVAGCEGLIGFPCPYYFKSIFLLHRGCGPWPRAATTVQVLTDTFHAVSCGEDGLCWIWKIRSGTPRQVFFPNRNCPLSQPLGPVLTVSVLPDATFILSGGADDAVGTTGSAYIWDWRLGFQKQQYKCGGGAILSSAPLIPWRQAVVGCANGYSTIWDWDNGATVDLPYCARSAEEIQQAIGARLAVYRNFHLPGMQRLAVERAMITEKAFMEQVKLGNPQLVKDMDFATWIYDLFHTNRFGAVLATSLVPVRQRFVTGTADGKVLYWNSDSGQLLRVMCGHEGRVNAVAGLPDNQQAVSGGDDGTARLWSLSTGAQLLMLYQPSGGPIRSVAVIPGGNKVALGSDDGYVRIWSLKTGVLWCAINTGGGAVRGLAVNPSNPLGQIITANADGYVRVFNPKEGEI